MSKAMDKYEELLDEIDVLKVRLDQVKRENDKIAAGNMQAQHRRDLFDEWHTKLHAHLP